jgi:hypothetical protein
MVLASVRSCFSWDPSYNQKYECGFSISLYVWVGVYASFPYLMLMFLYIDLGMSDLLFSCSFLPVAYPGIQIFVIIGMYSRLCTGILNAVLVFSYLMWMVCMNGCWADAFGLMPACILCDDVYSAAVCWRRVDLCVLMICREIRRQKGDFKSSIYLMMAAVGRNM